MQTYTVLEVQNNLARLVAEAANGVPFLIAQEGKPLVRVEALEPPTATKQRFGFMKGRIKVPDDFDRMCEQEIAEMFGVDK